VRGAAASQGSKNRLRPVATEADASQLPTDWADALGGRNFEVAGVHALVAHLYDENRRGEVLPQRTDVFRAFHLTNLNMVRVVILGQDPYPKSEQRPQGLSFSVPKGVRIPRALSAIFRNLGTDEHIDFTRPESGDLSQWAQQGVLLLNSALTVQEGSPGSHRKLWNEFSTQVLQLVSQERGHVAFLLWGNHAIELADAAGITAPPHERIMSSHPSAWGKSRNKRFRDSHPFSRANAFLTAHELVPVSWDLVQDPA
jgi:uracil-DNA glycosylase